MFNSNFYFDQQENAGGFLFKLKFNLKDKLNYLKCHRILTFVLNPELILIIRVVRSCGNAYDLFLKSHHTRANVNVEPCNEWEGNLSVFVWYVWVQTTGVV